MGGFGSGWWVGDFSRLTFGLAFCGRYGFRLPVSMSVSVSGMGREGWDGLYIFGDMVCLVVLR